MEPTHLAALLALIALGAYVQTVAGFALGLIVMGSSTLFGVAPLPFTAIVISFSALFNITLALHRTHHEVDRRITLLACIGLLPAVILGVTLLNHLSQAQSDLMHVVLGAFILIGGILLMLKPQPRATTQRGAMALVTGFFTGLSAGMFSAGGPPLVWYLYRQPLRIAVIRSTMLAIFAFTTVLRIGTVAIAGDLTREVLLTSALALPVVFLATLAGKRFPPPLSELAMRRFAFGLLTLLGLSLLLG